MKHFLLTAGLCLTALTQAAQAGDMVPLLVLKELRDDTVVATVTLSGTQIDPNTSSAGDQYELSVNDVATTVPQDYLSALAHDRRMYSYDNFTGGIGTDGKVGLCRMQGQAHGYVLETRYLTYENHKITRDEMHPVLSVAANCLFPDRTQPVNAQSALAASRAYGQLRGILAVLGQ